MGECFMFGRGKLQTLDPVFANNEWADIIAACQSGRIPSGWAVGDQKDMKINGTDYAIDIIGKNHDSYADGSGLAPLTFQLHDCLNDLTMLNDMNTNAGGWASSRFRTGTVMNTAAWDISKMPAEVQQALREVNKLTTIGGGSSTLGTTADKLFLLSGMEVFGRNLGMEAGEGAQYEYYANGGSRIKKSGISTVNWWLRSPVVNGTAFWAVSTSSYQALWDAHREIGVSFAFCF